jgi:pre-mRNA-processing factor 6
MSGYGPKSANTFSSAAVPSYYVAGIGRGAVGFTTRSDIGPARASFDAEATSTSASAAPSSAFPQPSFGQAPPGYVAGRGRGMGDLAREQGEMNSKQNQEEVDRADYSESNYDEFSGYGERLFASGVYDEDDREADRIYDSVDQEMANRSKRMREKQQSLLKDQQKQKMQRPSITEQFADLKRDLSAVSAEEWDAIPEVGDHSLKWKQPKKKDVFTPVPDSMIDSQSQSSNKSRSVVDAGEQSTLLSTSLASTRGSHLTSRLDKISDSISGQSVVDPKGYLTDLNSIKITSDAEIGDIKKARALLTSVTSTNPRHAPGWIAAARVEEFAGNMLQARKVIRQGCDINPDNDDLWIEAARLFPKDEAKLILAEAVKHIPTSVSIWTHAANLEDNVQKKKIVLRRALEFIPNSVKLWKLAIDLEDVQDARILLARAVECIPTAVDMWLALAKLESHENARKVLNQAREANPSERATWITAARLEEAHGNSHLVDKIIEKMMASLAQYQVVIARDAWIKEAEESEHAGAKVTCQAIIKNTIHLGVEDEDRKATWMDDAESCLTNSHPPAIETARAIYQVALITFPTTRALWLSAAVLEKEHGTADSLEAILKQGVKNCPQAEVLWLMAAKEKWLQGNVPASREILMEAFAANPQSEQIWLAAVKLEWENSEYQRARVLLARARSVEQSSTPRIWMKAALLEREVGDYTATLTLLDEAKEKYPTFAKFYMIAGQTCDDDLHDLARAKDYYNQGLKHCPTCVPLWKLLVYLEEKIHGANKARALLELARLKCPQSEELMLENIRLERRVGNEKVAESLMAKALQECSKDKVGMLWAEDILTCSKHQQKSKSVDALKRCDNDPYVILAVARLFEKDQKIDKARKWYDRVVTISPRYGDAWAYYYCFELKQQVLHSSKMSAAAEDDQATGKALVEEVVKRCVASDPNRGELWNAITKTTGLRRADIATKLKKVSEQLLAVGVKS